jgi:CheY-like chemotaxis protein
MRAQVSARPPFFIVTREPRKAAAMFTLPAAPRLAQSVRVLLVDDDELYAESIRCFLGYEDHIDVVGYARDGNEAVALASALRPDVVVMDLEMPRMDGFEATTRIKREVDGVIVVVLSSSTAPDDVRRSRTIGAAAYVTKTNAHDGLVPAILQGVARPCGGARPPACRTAALPGYARPALCSAA